MSQVSVVEVPLVPVLACWGSRQWSCGILWGQTRHFLARHRLPILSCSPIWHISLKTRFVFRIHQFTSHRLLEKMPPKKEKSEAKKTCVKTHEILWRSWRGTEISWNLGTQRAFGMSLIFCQKQRHQCSTTWIRFPTDESIYPLHRGCFFFPISGKWRLVLVGFFLPNQNTLSCTFFIPLWMQWQ